MPTNMQNRGRQCFASQWHHEFRELWFNGLWKEGANLKIIIDRLGPKSVNCAIVKPFYFSTELQFPTARYICNEWESDPLIGIIFKQDMAITEGIQEGFGPGEAIFRCLLDPVPAGFLRPVSGIKESKFLYAEANWIRLRDETRGIYGLPLFVAGVPIYFLFLRFCSENVIDSLDLSIVTSIMQAAQRCFSANLTSEKCMNILKKCICESRAVDPSFSIKDIQDEALRKLKWTSWYNCIPGMFLEDLPEIGTQKDALANCWEQANAIDPRQPWITIAQQFTEEQFFRDAHEYWDDEYHGCRRDRILSSIEIVKNAIYAHSKHGNYKECNSTVTHKNTEFNLSCRFIDKAENLLKEAHAKENVFDELKSLFCKSLSGTDLPRWYPLTLLTLFSMIGHEGLFGNIEHSLTADKLLGANAYDVGWECFILMELLKSSIGNVAFRLSKPGEGKFATILRFKDDYIGTGEDAMHITRRLANWGIDEKDTKARKCILCKGDELELHFLQNNGDAEKEKFIQVNAFINQKQV